MATSQPSPPLSPFDRVLDEFKNGLSPEELKDFNGATLANLKEKLAGLQQQQKARKTMQNLTRIQAFLDAMELYGKVLDVFVNVHNFVAFVWGPMKFLLLTASTVNEAFNGLLDAYKRIGDRLPVLEQYQSIYGSDQKVQKVLELTFRDIFDFHREALRYFRKPGWKLVFHATWHRFNTIFGKILDSLDQHKQLLSEQASIVHFQQSQEEYLHAAEARKLAKAHYKIQEDQERIVKLKHLATWLCAAEVHEDQERQASARAAHPTSCQWLLKKDLYKAWYDARITCDPFLWIYGIPGAGKSVLASFIIEETLKLTHTTTLFFYCRNEDPQRNTFVSVARSFLWELAQQNDNIADLIFDKCMQSTERLQLRTQKLAKSLLDSAGQVAGRLVITLDGLDECPEQEQKHVISWLKDFVEASSAGPEPSRCLVLSQYDQTTRSLLSKFSTLRMSALDNGADIQAYCLTRSVELQQIFSLDILQAKEIGIKTAVRAEGMFLFARLVMQHFCEQTNLFDLNEETRQILDVSQYTNRSVQSQHSAVFDKLDVAYSRILARIIDRASIPRRRDALQLLRWLVCALRPLTWQEIQTAVAIDVDDQKVDTSRRRILDAKELCGSLIDVGLNSAVDLVHSTAKVYLEKAGYVYPPDEHLALANLCLAHFCFPMFDTRLDDHELDGFLLQGSYGLLDYAAISWTTHMEIGLQVRKGSRTLTTTQLNEFEETLESFLDLHYQDCEEKNHIPRHFLPPIHTLRNTSLHVPALATMASVYKLNSAEVLDVERVSTLKVFSLLFRIRRRMECLMQANADDNQLILRGHYGCNLYKCPRMYCKWFHEGFDTLNKREVHREKHERSFYCPHVGCVSATLGWPTKKDLDGHINTYHKEEDEFPSEAEKSDPDPSRSEKQPGMLQCGRCAKTFSRRHNLQAHLLTHTNERPFACSVCRQRFARMHDRLRHERLHTMEKKLVCRGILSNGLPWGCGKVFARVDALERHFRSADGRVCVKPLEDEKAAERQNTQLTEQAEFRVPTAAELAGPDQMTAHAMTAYASNSNFNFSPDPASYYSTTFPNRDPYHKGSFRRF